MSDPLSIAGSIAGVISLVDLVFRLVFKYARSAVNAKEEVKNIADEIQALAGVLQSLRLLASGLEAEGDTFDPTIRVHHLGTLNTTLSRLQQRAQKVYTKFENGSKTQQKFQQLKWPFSTQETKELLEDLLRHKSTISLALSVDSLRKLQLCLTKQEELSQTLSSITNSVKRIEIQTLIAMGDHKKQVLYFFMKISPQPNLETSVKLRQPMTGLWLTSSPSFTTWLETPGSKLWLSGIPGAGKTVLAGAVIEDAITHSYAHTEVGVAFFFCDYKDSSSWNLVNILGAMASQLSRQNDDAYSSLQTYYDQLHPAGGLEKSPDTEDLRAKIIEMSGHFKQTLVIVDGLDECGDSTDVVVEALSELANYTPNMSMALFSRHEANIQDFLQEDFEHISIAAKSDDVRLYVGAEMEKRIQNRRLRITSIELKDEIMNKLVEGAKGMFRWVACQLDYLCDCVNDADRRKALSELPPDLPETYRRLLDRVNEKPAKVRSLVQTCLQFIAFASPPLTIRQLQQAISTPETPHALLDKSNLIPEDEIARRCSSLIRKSEKGEYFEFSHFSVKEFLTDASLLSGSALERYCLSESRSYTLIAMQCLRFLQLKNFDRRPEPSDQEVVYISERNEEYPFYEYAAAMWTKFARNYLGDPALLDLANTLFQRPKTFHFLAWSVEFVRHFLDISDGVWEFPYPPERSHSELVKSYVCKVTDDYFSPLHLAAALSIPEICKSLLDNKLELNHNSAWGSPLELATISLAAFSGFGDEFADHRFMRPPWQKFLKIELDIAPENRLATIELLVGAGAALNQSSQLGWSVLDLSFSLAPLFSGFSIAIKLMSLGAEPGHESPKIFHDGIAEWYRIRDLGGDTKQYKLFTEALNELVSFLGSAPICTMQTTRQILHIAFLSACENLNPLQDSCLDSLDLTYDEEALRLKLITAVCRDDGETLRNFLDIKRWDISEMFHPRIDDPSYGCSLLHLAAKNHAASTSQILLDFGYDLNARDSEGNLPIHLCGTHQDCFLLDLLLQNGASHLATQSRGENLWHLCVRSHFGNSILKRLLELDQNQTNEGLLARTPSGETPLLMAFAASPSIGEARILLIIDHCAGKPQFWKAHVPVFASAAMYGRETILDHLLLAGAEPDPIGNDNFTPLHALNGRAAPECARILMRLYPDAHNLRFHGHTPLELYIQTRLEKGKMPKSEVLAILATPDALSAQNTDGETVWSLCCQEIPVILSSSGRVQKDPKLFDGVISALLRLRAIDSYEKTKQQSGILPLLSSLGVEWKQNGLYTTSISRKTLSAVMLNSGYRDDAVRSPVAVAFLMEAIKDGNLQAVKLVLEYGVSVHQSVDQTSAMEVAVENFGTAGGSKCQTNEDVLRALLSHARPEEMRNCSHHGMGLGLLHMAIETHHQKNPNARWLLEELIRRGIDINGQARFTPYHVPLMHHLSVGSYYTAEKLLDLGADPAAKCALDPVTASLSEHGVLFLKRLLRYSKETGTTIQWNGIVAYSLEFEGSWKDIKGVNSLHYVASEGLNEILDLYISEDLLEDINATTFDGYTAVHLAAINDEAVAIHRLHARGASLAIQCHCGSTALHLAVRMKRLSAVKVLLDLGAKSSLDAVAMTPRMYASVLEDEDMIKLLDLHLPLGVETFSFVDAGSVSPKRMNLLARSFEKAIRKDDLEECQRLHRVGYPLNTSMPSCGGCSPMILAVRWERLAIVDWLLQCEATTLKVGCDHHGRYSVIIFAICYPSLHTIFNKLLTQYIEQGGDVLGRDLHAVNQAVMRPNNEGLRAILDVVEEMAESISCSLQISSTEIIASVLNQRWYNLEGDSFETPLHVAARYGNISAIKLLLDRGAIVDGCDSNHFTPLECVLTKGFLYKSPEGADVSLHAAKHLVQLGAATGLVLSWPPMLLFESISSSADLPELLFEQTAAASYKQAPHLLDKTVADWYVYQLVPRDTLLRLQGFVNDLAEEDFGGRSFLHWAICSSAYSELLPRWSSALQKTTPFPWHCHWTDFHEMVFLRSGFKLYRQRLPHATLVRIMNLQPERGISPLCRASSRGILEIMENCLTMGAEIDFEGCTLGSALMIACACGRLDAVKFLVRRGAAISYVGKGGLTSAVLAGRRSKGVIAWLLVGQFNEQHRLNGGTRAPSDSGVEAEIRPWSGIGKAAFPLVGSLEIRRGESSLDYATRLSDLRREMRGVVVPLGFVRKRSGGSGRE